MNQKQEQIAILLIEDDPMVQEVNRMFVEKINGFTVVGVASNGDEGLERVKVDQPDLILLDVYMPGKDGLAFIQQLRQEQYDVDIIAVTAANDTQTVKTLLRYGVNDYIVKPFTFERLQKALAQYKEVYQQLTQSQQFSQDTLDQMITQKPDSSPENLPKGLHAQTLNQIYQYLKQLEEPKSAEEVGADVGLARVTVRRYLSYLESVNKVEMQLIYGTIGRPIQMYRLKPSPGV